MIVPGLVSVTLRQCGIDEVVGVAAECGLRAIHWGGDVHVPVADHSAARRARRRCHAAEIEIEGYGSYYRAGHSDPRSFDPVVETALTLGADRIRVWAGTTASAATSPVARTAVIADLRRCAEIAAARGVRIVLEYHPNTLTDELGSALAVLEATDAENVATYWQPAADPSPIGSVREIASLRPKLLGAHVFAWGPGGNSDRLALAEHRKLWKTALREMDDDAHRRYALMEFVQLDSIEMLRRDAATLQSWLN